MEEPIGGTRRSARPPAAAFVEGGLDPRHSIQHSVPATAPGRCRQPRRFRSRLGLLGPAFVAAIGYIDPGNFATNIEAGAEYGYTLLWVVFWANLMAVLIQLLASKLGLATRSSLAAAIRDHLPPWGTYLYWLQAEILAIATDLAEFVGAALGFQLLLGMSLLEGALCCTAAVSWLLLALERGGLKPLEFVIGSMLGAVALSYLAEVVFSHPEPTAIVAGVIIPRLNDSHSIYLAAGILGATVMPHVIYLHSALSRADAKSHPTTPLRRLFHSSCADVGLAMALASFVNLAMLAMAAAVFHGTSHQEVADIATAYRRSSPCWAPGRRVCLARR
jgi:manganese transport protein